MGDPRLNIADLAVGLLLTDLFRDHALFGNSQPSQCDSLVDDNAQDGCCRIMKPTHMKVTET